MPSSRAPALALMLAFLASASCARIPSMFEPDVDRRPAQYPNPHALPPFIRMNDSRAHLYFRADVSSELAANAWRWTGKRPVLAFPMRDIDGYKFLMEYTVPPFTFDQTGPVNLTVTINQHALETIHVDAQGQKRYEHAVPADWLRRDADNEVVLEIDKVATEHGIERGFILTSIGFVK